MHSLTRLLSASAPVPNDAPVTWIGGPPLDEEARMVWEALGHPMRYGALIDEVAERLFRRDLATVGAAADVGFFRPFYVAHARALVAALAGTRLRIGGPA